MRRKVRGRSPAIRCPPTPRPHLSSTPTLRRGKRASRGGQRSRADQRKKEEPPPGGPDPRATEAPVPDSRPRKTDRARYSIQLEGQRGGGGGEGTKGAHPQAPVLSPSPTPLYPLTHRLSPFSAPPALHPCLHHSSRSQHRAPTGPGLHLLSLTDQVAITSAATRRSVSVHRPPPRLYLPPQARGRITSFRPSPQVSREEEGRQEQPAVCGSTSTRGPAPRLSRAPFPHALPLPLRPLRTAGRCPHQSAASRPSSPHGQPDLTGLSGGRPLQDPASAARTTSDSGGLHAAGRSRLICRLPFCLWGGRRSISSRSGLRRAQPTPVTRSQRAAGLSNWRVPPRTGPDGKYPGGTSWHAESGKEEAGPIGTAILWEDTEWDTINQEEKRNNGVRAEGKDGEKDRTGDRDTEQGREELQEEGEGTVERREESQKMEARRIEGTKSRKKMELQRTQETEEGEFCRSRPCSRKNVARSGTGAHWGPGRRVE
ncbi:hypothetical protein NDU88_003336 [Pleurodeles waltl]|uniref:Uncharacterized protein n=1 Tax=Pleurodeles waltl TaxID=8319 RepID=A0AAV7SDD1_PLEWA|nr:hypothetical protein NDU88_003336 [Pleurodeles waltl]